MAAVGPRGLRALSSPGCVCVEGSLGEAGRELEPPALELSPSPSHGRLQQGAELRWGAGQENTNTGSPSRLGTPDSPSQVRCEAWGEYSGSCEALPPAERGSTLPTPTPSLALFLPPRWPPAGPEVRKAQPLLGVPQLTQALSVLPPSAHAVMKIVEQPPDSGTAPLLGPRGGGRASGERACLCCLWPVSPRALEGGEDYSSEPAWGGVS